MRIGSVELEPLTDSVGEIADLTDAYPGVPAEDWQPYRDLYPDLFAGHRWRLPCVCYLIRSGARTILVDTGAGPPGFWKETPELEGGLLPELADRGVDPQDVDDVFITHVHGDHIGWNTDAAGEVVFQRARYLLHPEAVAHARERLDEPHVERVFRALFERDAVLPVAPATEIAPGVVTTPLPGHQPGHCGLSISSDGAEGILVADAVPHPALADQPDWVFDWDRDPELATRTRRALVEELVDSDTLVVCGHYPAGGIGRFRTRDGRVVWEPASG